MSKEINFEKIHHVIDRIAERQEKTDRQIEKTHQEIRELRASQAETGRQIKDTNRKLESFGFVQGEIAEDLIRVMLSLFFKAQASGLTRSFATQKASWAGSTIYWR